MSGERERLEAVAVDAAADVERIRAENAIVAADYRLDPTDDGKEQLKRGAASLSAARDRLDAAAAALTVFDQTGSPYGLLSGEGRVTGMIGLVIPPGTGREAREKLIDAKLSPELDKACDELGCAVLAASPEHYTRELPGRDPEGRTVFEVGGRVEGDRLIPAVSRASKRGR